MDIKRVEKFFELLTDTDIKELCWEKAGLKLRMKRGNVCTEKVLEENVVASETNDEQSAEVFDQELIKSKFVGSFVASNGKNKVEIAVGDRIQNGQVVGYVEAMNILKEVTSDISGVVKEVKIKNKDHVEYAQELFVIDIK